MSTDAAHLAPFPTPKSALGIAVRLELERLAIIRTACSSERSLKSWMRTTVSLYSFGFTIAKFFDFVAQSQSGSVDSSGPGWVGLAFVTIGIVSLGIAVFEYMKRLVIMRDLGLYHFRSYFLPVGIALILIAIGLASAVGITVNLSN